MSYINQQTADKLINIIENGVFIKKYTPRLSKKDSWHESYKLEITVDKEDLEFNLQRKCKEYEAPSTIYTVDYNAYSTDKKEDNWSYLQLRLQNEQEARVMSAMERRVREEGGVREETYAESQERKEDGDHPELLAKVVDRFLPEEQESDDSLAYDPPA